MQAKNLTQRLGILDHITPAAARAAGSYVTGAVDASRFERLVAVLQVGTLAGAATLNARFQSNSSASSSADSAWADIDSTNCITSTFASTSNDKLAPLELRLDQNPTVSRYVRALVSAAVSTWLGGLVLYGEPAIFAPASQFNNAAVATAIVF
jgi:hypothetical protein